jgi:dTMP kinase
MQKKGFFITIEGPEGAGKSTQLQKIAEYLESIGATCVRTREPGGTPLAEDLRNVVKEYNGNEKVFPETELLLMEAARSQHMNVLVLPALAEGKVVICDRFSDSTLAYQGYARGIGIERVLEINMFAREYLPKVTYFFDVTPEVGLARIQGRDKIDRLDLETMDFHQKVYEGYKEVCRLYPERVKSINGERKIEEIIDEVYNDIKTYL